MAEVVGPTPAQPMVFQEYGRAVAEHTERLPRVDPALQPQGQTWRWVPVVAARQARRGVQFTAAVTLSAALGELSRFANPRHLMSSLGLTPSEHTSGERRRQGALPTTGTSPARRALSAGAWAYRSPAQVSRHRQLRLEKLPKVSQEIRWKAPVRLCNRYRRLRARGKNATSGGVASAREMAACVGASARTGKVA